MSCRGPDVGKGSQPDAAFFEIVGHDDEIPHVARKPVQLPDHERIAGFEFLQTAAQGRAVGGASLLCECFYNRFFAQQGAEVQLSNRDAAI